MNAPMSEETLSRISKLFVDQDGEYPDSSLRRRSEHCIQLCVGDDVAESQVLQLAVLTAANLASRCFPGALTVQMSEELRKTACLVSWPKSPSFGDAVSSVADSHIANLAQGSDISTVVFGNAISSARALRVTFDGWRASVGPVANTPRLAERPYCSLAGVAAGALAVGEIFYAFAHLSVEATRRQVGLSLWRPDLPISDEATLGEPVIELPAAVGVFGLGHLGQAYLWALASLPYTAPSELIVTLCDDDIVKKANVETGAVFTYNDIGFLKTRVNSAWLESRGFKTRLIERRVDENFRRTEEEPVIALSGFDDNRARRWLAKGKFSRVFDSGLGGNAENFDTISFHSFPNVRSPEELWPVETPGELAAATAKRQRWLASNPAYQSMSPDECGRLLLANKSVAVPFVGAMASCLVVSELLKMICGGPRFDDLKVRLNALRGSVSHAVASQYHVAELSGVKLISSRTA